MSTVMHELHRDHSNMARLLALLEQQTSMLDSMNAPDYGLLEDIMHYMVHYADEYHHAKEDLIFDKFVLRDPGGREAVDRLKSEHGELARKGNQFFGSIRSVNDGTIMTKDQFVAEGKDYIRALRAHMKAEEEWVFPAITKVLTPKDWAEIGEKMQRREDPIFGEVVQERYHQLYDQIMRLAR